MSSTEKTQTIPILWTGGWDSTYRVLDLLYNSDTAIQPYYLIYLGRASTLHELRAINIIMDELSRFGDRLRHPVIALADRFKYATEPYASALKQVLETHHLGSQYLCIAQFRDRSGINGLELCAETGGGAWHYVNPYLKHDADNVSEIRDDAPEAMRILLGGFRYPIFHLTKRDMENRAREGGFLDILEHTWFCHNPKDGQPCGECNPCHCTIEQGLGRRIPVDA